MNKPGRILLKLILFGTVTTSVGVAAEPYSQTVKRVSRLQTGTYVGEPDADEACVDGQLTLKDQPDGRVTVYLGGHVIIPSVGEPESGEERDLRWTSKTELTDRRIVWRKKGVLGNQPIRWETTLTVHNGGFTYVASQRGKPYTCVLTLR